MGGALVVATVLVVLLGPVAWYLAGDAVRGLGGKEQAEAINVVRQTVLTAFGGTVILAGLAFTARTYYLSREGQLTDRYTKAIEQLGSEKLDVRLGGIYALERIMADSPRDHDSIVDVLTAFLREHAQRQARIDDPDEDESERPFRGKWWVHDIHGNPRPSADVQAAAGVLARRPERPERHRLNLRWVNLRGAELAHARFRHADLIFADLRGSDLRGADLRHAELDRADLSRANLDGADLRHARLEGVKLRNHARLVGADLRHAYLGEADLAYCALSRADLRDAILSDANLTKAYLNGTRLEGATLAAHAIDPDPTDPYDGGSRSYAQAAMMREDLKRLGGTLEAPKGLTAEQLLEATLDEVTVLPEEMQAQLAILRHHNPTGPAGPRGGCATPPGVTGR